MSFRFHLSSSAVFAVMWVSLSALVWHDISLRHHQGGSGASFSDRVVTKEFTLVDDNGTTRARIGMSDKTNAPSVQLFDAAGGQRAQLRLNKDDVPSLRLYNADGKIKSVVGFTLNDMQPTFVTFDANGVGHVENRTRPDTLYANVQDEDLCNGRYVQSYRGGMPTYIDQTQSTNWKLFADQTQASAASARAAELAAQQVQLQAERAERARQEVELARQRVIDATADRVNIEVDPIRTGGR